MDNRNENSKNNENRKMKTSNFILFRFDIVIWNKKV